MYVWVCMCVINAQIKRLSGNSSWTVTVGSKTLFATFRLQLWQSSSDITLQIKFCYQPSQSKI